MPGAEITPCPCGGVSMLPLHQFFLSNG